MHAAATKVLSLAMLALGAAMIVLAIARGGGPLATGVLLGVLFCAAGLGRLYASRDAR